MKTKNTNPQFQCDRKEDLVAYLYGEATAAEQASLESHLDECDPCNDELKAVGRVRDELSTWQVGFAPRTELVLPRSKMDVLRELIGMFPIWARGLAMAGTAAAIVLLAMAITSKNPVNGGNAANTPQNVAAMSSQQIESLVKAAVAEERAKMQQEYQAQFANFKTQLNNEHQAQLQAQLQEVSAAHQARLQTMKASLQAEIKKSSRQNGRQNGSIRSFFLAEGYQQDPWSDVK
jgi:anti-sigma factor RsiW